jgi:hypothetical protein
MFQRVTRLDTTLWLPSPRRLGPDEWLRTHVTLPVSPSTESIQRLIVRAAADRSHGQLFGRPIALPDYSRPGLRISDVVLASPDSGGKWSRGGVSLSFVPTREFAGGAFRLFYEIYGLAADARIRTEITIDRAGGGIGRAISRLFGGGGPAVSLRFDETANPDDNGIVRAFRRVGTMLSDGRYVVKVKVTDLDSDVVTEQEREFSVARTQ